MTRPFQNEHNNDGFVTIRITGFISTLSQRFIICNSLRNNLKDNEDWLDKDDWDKTDKGTNSLFLSTAFI